MALNGQTIRLLAVFAVFALLYGGRLTKGVARQTPGGLEFAMKTPVMVSRIAALVLYFGFFAYTLHVRGTGLPFYFYALFPLVIGITLIQLPGTILLGEEAVTQSFWFFKQRVLRYPEVMALQRSSAVQSLRVMGDNRVVITHTNNHAAAEQFLQEMQRRTGKRAG